MRTEKKIKSTIALLLTVCLTLRLLTGLQWGMLSVWAANDDSTIYLGVNGIQNPASENLQTSVAWSGDYVYFGVYNNNAIRWRVLDKSGNGTAGNSSVAGGMLLHSDNSLTKRNFEDMSDSNSEHIDGSGNTIPWNTWEVSDIRTWLQGNEENQFLYGFTSLEQNVVMVTASSSDGNSPSSMLNSIGLSNDTLFLLDCADLNNQEYGYIKGTYSDNTNLDVAWWLRSPGFDSQYAGVVGYGEMYHNITDRENDVVPAVNLNLSSIFFSSANGISKSSALASTAGSGDITEWKLTLLDTAQSVDIDDRDGKAVARSDRNGITTISIPYCYSYSGNGDSFANQLSVMITDKEYTDSSAGIRYYGKVSGNSDVTDGSLNESGIVSFDLPDDYNSVTDKVYLLSEQVNGQNRTDYAGTPIEIIIPTTYTITYDANGGTGIMNNETAEVGTAFTLSDCSFTAPAGKQFREWAIGDVNGITQSPGESYTFTENTTVYAVWEEIPHIHDLTYVKRVEADCITDGNKEYYTCTCGTWFWDEAGQSEIADKNSVRIPATGHDFGEWQKDETNHWKVCGNCGIEADRAVHTWNDGVVTKEPTDTEQGEKIYTCMICGQTRKEEMSPTEHLCNHEDTILVNEKQASCTEKGYTGDRKCVNCGILIETGQETESLGHLTELWYYDTLKHWHVCSRCNIILDTAEHIWDNGSVTKEPTETETGIKTYVCTVCGETKAEWLDKVEPAPVDPTEPNDEPNIEPNTEPESITAESVIMESSETVEKEENKDLPNTGDSSEIGQMLAIIVISGIVLAFLGRKKNDNIHE